MSRRIVALALLLTACGADPSCNVAPHLPAGWTIPIGFFSSQGTTLDLTTQVAADAALTYSRTGGDLYLQTSASTVTKLVAGSGSTFEDRGEVWGAGPLTLPAYSDDLANPLNIGGTSWANSAGVTVTQNNAAAPDGTTTATKFVVANDAATCGQTGASVPSGSSVWVRDDVSSPPTATCTWIYSPDYSLVSLGTGSTWRRIHMSGLGPFSGLLLVGSQPQYPLWQGGGPSAGVVYTPSSGTLYAWGAMATAWGDVPLVDGSTGITNVQLSAANVAKVIQGGDLDIELTYEQLYTNANYVHAADQYLFSADDPGGEISLRFATASAQLKLKVNGSDVLATGGFAIGVGPQYTDMRTRVTYRVSTNTALVRQWQNGSSQANNTASGTTSGGPLSPITAFYLGSHGGATGGLPAKWRSLKFNDSDVYNPELIILGDSKSAFVNAANPWPMMGSFIYTLAESRTRRGIESLSHAGDTAANQEAAFLASPYRATVPFVDIDDLGVNNINQNQSAAGTIAELQHLVNTIRATNPTCKIIIGQITPAHTYFVNNAGTAPNNEPNWTAINIAIAGGGGTPIIGVDAVVTSYMATLDNGSHDLKDIYNFGDFLHIDTNAKRDVMGPAERAALNSLGF